jgi:Predicted transcriptional regulators
MEIKQVITDIRSKNGLSQEAMADRLYVTRQAVSRWENGETTPNIETLKKISTEFNVAPGALLGFDEPAVCQSCGMDLGAFDDFGTDADGGIHTDYCRYCFQQGSFTQDRTIDEMVEFNLRFLDEYNKAKGLSYTPDEARRELRLHLSTLKRWK